MIRQEIRISGVWEEEDDFEPDEWIIEFTDDGKFREIFRPGEVPNETTEGRWFIDSAGIISIYTGRPEIKFCQMCVFNSVDKYLYLYNDAPHIRPDREAIIEYHAHKRWKTTPAEAE